MRPYDKRARLQARAALIQKPDVWLKPLRQRWIPAAVVAPRLPELPPRTPASMGRVRGVTALNPIYPQTHPFWWLETT